MSATGFVDACGFVPASSGIGDFVVSVAVTGYQTPASAGAVNATVYSYRAQSADLSQWEEGFGAYTVGSTTLARTTVTANSSGGTGKITFSAAPNVYITAASADLQNAALLTSGTLPAARIAFAAKSDQQTGTSTTLPVAPAHMQDHDGVAKARVYFTLSGTTITVQDSYNVTSVTRNGVGDYSVTFTTPFASANYACSGVATNASQNQFIVPVLASVTASVYRLATAVSSASAAEATSVSLICFGRQ